MSQDPVAAPRGDGNKKPKKRNRIEAYASLEEALASWDKCLFITKDRNKFCNQRRSVGSQFCGNHRPEGEGVASARRLADALQAGVGAADIRRVPCPLDPNHTVYEHELAHHMKVCPVARRQQELKEKGYYCQDCNSIANAVTVTPDSVSTVDPERLLEKIRRCYHACVEHELTEGPSELEASVKDTVLDAVAGESSAFSKMRHGLQDAYLVQKMMDSRVLASGHGERTVVVELGAGRGMLGLAIMSVLPQPAAPGAVGAPSGAADASPYLVMIERNGLKFKADKIMRERSLGHCRIRMDIRHCLLPSLPVVRDIGQPDRAASGPAPAPAVVLVAKHLCGLATDLSVRSIQHLVQPQLQQGGGQARGPLFQGLAIATCCHHACAWADYTGARWLLAQGFTEAEFGVMKQWSGWAHTIKLSADGAAAAGDGSLPKKRMKVEDIGAAEASPQEEEVCCEHSAPVCESTVRPSGLTPLDMSATGKLVKRVLDQGRVQYLRELGLPARQVRYCDPSLSPECFMIVATNPLPS